MRWRSQAVGLRWLLLPRAVPVIADFHTSASRLVSELGPAANPVRTSEVVNVHASFHASFPGDLISVDAGWSADVMQFNNALGGLFQDVAFDASRLDRFVFYLEPE